jgi:hypothetical protein
MNLTTVEKIEALEDARASIEAHGGCLCPAIDGWIAEHTGNHSLDYCVIQVMFDLNKHKPEKVFKITNDAWWPLNESGKRIRIGVIDALLTELKAINAES